MSYLYEFDSNDKFINRVITHPEYTFTMYSGSVHVNNRRFAGVNIPTGSISAFELNVDRDGTNQALIYPFVVKDQTFWTFRSITTATYQSASYGTILTGTYPLTSSIQRDVIASAAAITPTSTTDQIDVYFAARKKMIALRNTLDYYSNISESYRYSRRPTFAPTPFQTATINMIQIPSIFYDSGIKKGTVELGFYYTGSLMDRATDHKQNGQLISTMGATSGSVVGVVLYNEGFVLLTSSVPISTNTDDYLGSGTNVAAQWLYFGSYTETSSSLFSLSFKGTNKIPTMTMFSHAETGQLTNSQNPTWISSSANRSVTDNWRSHTVTGSLVYAEPRQTEIKNTIQSQYCDFEDGFEKQVFISKIGLFDKDKNLIGTAKIANPVLKHPKQSFTFKLRLDM